MSTSIYDLLTGIQVESATTTQLDTAGGRTYIDKDSIEFWQGILTMSHIIKATRQYGGGLPIPEASATGTMAIGDGVTVDVQPAGTEVWLLQNFHADSTTLYLYDGTTESQVTLGTSDLTPIYLTNSCYMRIKNAAGSEKNPSWAYHKVGL
jgi:hypothetical protein